MADLIVRIGYAGIILIPVTFFHFFLNFLEIKNKIDRYLLYSSYFLAGVFELFLLTTNYFVSGHYNYFWGYYPKVSFLHPIYLILLNIVLFRIIYLLFLFLSHRGESTPYKYQQVKYLLVALIFYAFAASDFFINYGIEFYPFGFIFILIFLGIIGYTIARYRLMDIRIVARKIFIYFGVAGFAYGIFYLVVWIYSQFLGGVFSRTGYLAGLVIAPIFVAALYGVERLLKIIANKYFFVSLYNYQETINKLANELNYYIELDKIVDAIVNTIKKTMQLDRTGVLLINQGPSTSLGAGKNQMRYQVAKVIGFNEKNGISLVQDNFLTQYLQKIQKPLVGDELNLLSRDAKTKKDQESFSRLREHMKRIEASICLPLLSSNKLIGIIVLGAKISKDAYTKEDLELLDTLSKQAGIAIDNAQLYQEVQDFNKTLKQRVDEQTREIKEKNIHLEELLKMKTEFLDIASHQLKTPISITRGYLSMILDGTLKEPAKKDDAIKKAMFGINRLNETVKDFLDASDLEGEKIELDLEKTDLTKLVAKLCQEKEILAKDKNLKLVFASSEKKPIVVSIDSSRLSEAISNLIDNAIFYTEKGGVAVSADLSADKKSAIIKIADTGIGISASDRKRLFNKFTRGEKAVLTKPDGSGLGLYITQKIVESHHGKVDLQSEVGKGSTFSVTLPEVTRNR